MYGRLLLAFVVGAQVTALRLQSTVEVHANEEQCNLRHQAHQEPREFSKFKHGAGAQGLYVNTQANFAFCTIEKNACSQWTAILRKLEKKKLEGDAPSYAIAQQTYNDAKAQKVFGDPKAVRAVFIRDPLERFLSAFLDKCFDLECANPFCIARGFGMKSKEITFETSVNWILSQRPLSLDGHWRLQSDHCELKDRIDEFTHIGFMNADTLAVQATCLLREAGLSHLNVRNKGKPGLEKPFWDKPRAGTAHNGHWQLDTIEYLKKFYSKEAAEAMYNYFAQDYDTFKLPRPAWIGNATGEFFNQTRTTNLRCPQALNRERAQLQEEKDEVDLIPMLAQRSGFSL